MSPIRMQRIESAMRVVLEYVAAFNRHDAMLVMSYLSDDCVYQDAVPAPDGDVFSGKEALSRYFRGLFEKVPCVHIEIEDIFGFGPRCILRLRYEWTDEAGIKRHVRMLDVFKVEHEKIREVLSYMKG
ncbi:MAG: nuclear transport factor 2 family protein [Treponemataceae bacterium]